MKNILHLMAIISFMAIFAACGKDDIPETDSSTGLAPGVLPGKFSVAQSRQVCFSQGNLRYQASTDAWCFADRQYQIVGMDNEMISNKDTGWIDLFGWGTSGWDSGAHCYLPWLTDLNCTNYYPGGSSINSLTYYYAHADWGVHNAIQNGGNKPGLWRTLTKDEWVYLFDTRQASTLNGTDNARYAEVRVDDIGGIMLFPDSFSWPDESIPQPAVFNTHQYGWNNLSYSVSQFQKLEEAGVVFLPAAGYREGTSVRNVCEYGYYWTASHHYDASAYCLYFCYDQVDPQHYDYRCNGFSVRLVSSAE